MTTPCSSWSCGRATAFSCPGWIALVSFRPSSHTRTASLWITDGPSMNREQLLAQLASMLLSIQQPHPIRVAVDGIDAAGKTTLADELAAPIESRRRGVRAGCRG